MEAEHTLLNNQQITEEIKKEIKICTETNENENTTTLKSKPHPSKALTLFDFRKAGRGEGAAEEECESSRGGHTAPGAIFKT